jgi:hypothetical protein
VGEPHEFVVGSGRLAFLDIMGLAGNVHEVCLDCAHPSSEAVVVGGLELAASGPQTRREWINERVNEARRLAGGNADEWIDDLDMALYDAQVRELLVIVEEFAGLLRDHFAGSDS